MSFPTRSIIALAAAASLAACGAPRAAAQGTPHVHGVPRSDSAALAAARPDHSRYPWTEADAQFMSAMIGHHAQAIEMSRLAPTRTETHAVRVLADRIINAQEGEIGTMQTWLRDRGQPVPEPQPTSAMHHAHGAGHGEMMPGMLTPEQLAQLEQARGTEFDRLFLTYMIQHHRGATAMVTRLFGTTGAGQDETVFKFASDVNVDQTTEIARMQKMLADLLFGSPPGSP